MREMTYDVPSWLIAVMLIIAMAAAMEIGYRASRRTRGLPTAVSKRSVNSMQSSILLILALLLAFTLSIALQRYEQRSDAVVDEANAIGTVYLRTQLLRQPARDELQPMVRDYLAMRVKSASMTTVEGARRDAVLDATEQAQGVLWSAAVRAAQADPSPVTSGLFVQALNDMIDSYGRRDAGLNRHVPEGVALPAVHRAGDRGWRCRFVVGVLRSPTVARKQPRDGAAGRGDGFPHHRPRPTPTRIDSVSHAPLIDLLASIDPKPAQPR